MELKCEWASAATWSMDYWSRRDVQSRLGGFLRQSASNCRNARLVFSGGDSGLQVSLADIVDEAVSEGGKPFRRSLGNRGYPLLTMDTNGEVVRNFYPGNLTFPLVWMPPLANLAIACPKRTEISLRLKSGFRRVPTGGVLETTMEEEGECLVRLRTRFALDSSPRGWLTGRLPTRFHGQSNYLFDRQLGRMVQGEASSELEQDLFLFHCRESWQMKLGTDGIREGLAPKGTGVSPADLEFANGNDSPESL